MSQDIHCVTNLSPTKLDEIGNYFNSLPVELQELIISWCSVQWRLVSNACKQIADKYVLLDPSFVVDRNYNEPIRKASAFGYLKTVQWLLQNENVDPSASNNEALIDATRGGHIEVVRLLLDHDYVSCDEAILDACIANNIEIVKMMLPHVNAMGVEVGYEAMRTVFNWERVEILRLFVEELHVDLNDHGNVVSRARESSPEIQALHYTWDRNYRDYISDDDSL